MEADRFGLVRQIIGIDADAVAADETGAEGLEVPLGAGRLEHLARLEAELLEQHGELVDQRDVHVALNVLDDLGGLGDADRARAMGAGGDDLGIDGVDEIGGFRRRAGGDLDDVGEAVLEVARVDALGRIAGEEVAIEGEARGLLELGHADLLGRAGIDRRFVHHHVARGEHLAYGAARGDERAEIRALRLIDRRRNGDDIEIRLAQALDVRGVGDARGSRELLLGHLARAVDAARQLVDAGRVDVEAKHGKVPRQIDGERQADIAKTDNANSNVGELWQFHALLKVCGKDDGVRGLLDL